MSNPAGERGTAPTEIDPRLGMMNIMPWLRGIAAQAGFPVQSGAAETLVTLRLDAMAKAFRAIVVYLLTLISLSVR